MFIYELFLGNEWLFRGLLGIRLWIKGGGDFERFLLFFRGEDGSDLVLFCEI